MSPTKVSDIDISVHTQDNIDSIINIRTNIIITERNNIKQL